MDSAIALENATKVFLEGTVVAFRQLTLAVDKDEVLCVVGPSGCGKTTLLRCIGGLTNVRGGSVLVHGKPVASPPRGVATSFQHFGLLPWKTVYENAALGLAMLGTPRPLMQGRVGHYPSLVVL